ncbi:hypothetical protein Skr01_55930 [Sphaerisporangium krabiense]|uniref:Phosphoglycerol transferase MdoB-like AlkP superfamily enzyme n=1 Tax=Sphaerisporangium krabiense TaxID=763782 RepID=A0A7W8ZB84_9ACTN|nr:hypothetical protein [Sphaerisporangium krabiense]MBB5630809.1 phosphoglycerol transferase MdoB-like AlkP superfamily enzyme [Sphaerisporangium krabiense]GII65508.1 hypothetical protein Skr01_55930 [Sphaerisporangium krabiense]
MGRILLIAIAVIAGFFLLGSVLGLIAGLVKWALIIGVVALAVLALTKIFSSRAG